MAKSIVDWKRGQKNKDKIFKGLIKRGFSKEEASVIMGNLRQESAYDHEAELQGDGEDSYGLMQWRAERLDSLSELATSKNKTIADLDVQLDFIKKELKDGGYETKQFKKAMAVEGDLADKTMAFAKYVERPHKSHLKKGSASYRNRTEAAQEFFDLEIKEPEVYGPSDEELMGGQKDLPEKELSDRPLASRDLNITDKMALWSNINKTSKSAEESFNAINKFINEKTVIPDAVVADTEFSPDSLRAPSATEEPQMVMDEEQPVTPSVSQGPSVVSDEVIPELESVPRAALGGRKMEYSSLAQDIENFTFEGMGTDLVNKFTDRNAIGFLTSAAINYGLQTNKVDPSFNIEGQDKELYQKMTEGLEADEVASILDNSFNRGDFIKNASFAQGRKQRKQELTKYATEHPVLSGVNSVGNILVEGGAFMPVGTLVTSASKATKIKRLSDLTRTATRSYLFGELAEQGIQEIIWAANDSEYEFDPVMFATSVGVGVGLKTVLGATEADKALRDFLKDEGGFINIATKEGKKLVDEVAANINDNNAIALAQRVSKKKTKIANEIRKNLEAKRASLVRRSEILDRKIKGSADPNEIKKWKGTKQKITRQLSSFDKRLPSELESLATGTHPKLTAAVNPELSIKTIAKELGIDNELVNTVEKTRKFLGLDKPNVDPEFVFEGEKAYQSVARTQLREIVENRRLNMNETLRYAAGSDTVRTLDELPVIGKLQIGNKLMSLADTDGPMSKYLFNKGNLVSSDNELVASFYNWMAPDGVGRQGMSKIRAIESQQKYANIYGGDLMNMYHSHGDRLYTVLNGDSLKTKAKGIFSVDDYEMTVEPILKERLLSESGEAFRAKYGDAVADIADDFYDDFNKLNKKIVERAKELGVEGVDFDATEGWFHRSWDFRKARAVDADDLSDTVYRGMKSHMEKLGVKMDDSAIKEHARKFAYGLRNADMSTIEGLQSDHIKLLSRLADKAEGTEAKVIRTEIERLKTLKAKADAGDLANRVQMDVSVKLADGRPLSSLFEDNIINTQKRYTSRMAARISAAEHGIKNLDSLDEWIDDAVALEVKRLAEQGVKNPKSRVDFIKKAMKEDLMSFRSGGMVGLHDLPDDSANEFIRLVKKYNFARLMQYVGISSIAELGGTMVEAGVSTTLGEMGRTMRTHFNDLFTDNPQMYTGRLYDELRTITGVGMEDFSFSSKGMSKANRVFEEGALGTFEKGVDVLGRVSQMPFGGIERAGRRLTVNSLAIKWANHFKGTETGGVLSAFFGSNGVTNRVLENSGFGSINSAGKFIPNDNYKNIQKSIKQFASFDNSGRLVKLNLEKWDNATAHAFGDAIQLQASHIMVNPDSTTMALWQSSTIGQILNQFRSFTVNATTKVMGHTAANAFVSSSRGDHSELIKAGQKIFWGTTLGMLSVATRQAIQRAGGDKEVDLFDEGLIKAAAIGFSRSSVAGNLPTISDTISGSFGYDPIFEKTSSVGRSKNFFNLATTPTGQAFTGVYQGGEKVLQGDYKAGGLQLLKASPIYRQIGAQQIFNFIDDEK